MAKHSNAAQDTSATTDQTSAGAAEQQQETKTAGAENSTQTGAGQDGATESAATTTQGDAENKKPPHFTRDNIAGIVFGLFSKRVPTQAVRIDGPFTTQTLEGTLLCDDGWLALDGSNNPYPISAEQFELLYGPGEAMQEPGPKSANALGGPEPTGETLVYGASHSYCNNVEYLRERMMLAILQNPNIERLCYGNPLDKGRKADYASAGDLLAHLCDQLAVDYFEASRHVDTERRHLLGINDIGRAINGDC